MSTNTSTSIYISRQPLAAASAPDQEETLKLDDLLGYFRDFAGAFDSFKALQGMFNDFVASGAMERWTKGYAETFMHHFTLISEVIFKLETQAANDKIKEIKARATTRMAG